uniref:Uncharacterized protein n=1 Tax=Phytophthora ramorum TaxID=164328 RepID=H3GH07_PHYRM
MRAAGTDGPTGAAPLLTPILPPMIGSVSHEALVKWKRDRHDNESKMQARYRVTGEDFAAVVQSIRDPSGPHLLDAFCEIEHIVCSIKSATLPDIKELFKKELRMKKDACDVNARLIDYFKSFSTIIEDHGLAECFNGVLDTNEEYKRLISDL